MGKAHVVKDYIDFSLHDTLDDIMILRRLIQRRNSWYKFKHSNKDSESVWCRFFWKNMTQDVQSLTDQENYDCVVFFS